MLLPSPWLHQASCRLCTTSTNNQKVELKSGKASITQKEEKRIRLRISMILRKVLNKKTWFNFSNLNKEYQLKKKDNSINRYQKNLEPRLFLLRQNHHRAKRKRIISTNILCQILIVWQACRRLTAKKTFNISRRHRMSLEVMVEGLASGLRVTIQNSARTITQKFHLGNQISLKYRLSKTLINL